MKSRRNGFSFCLAFAASAVLLLLLGVVVHHIHPPSPARRPILKNKNSPRRRGVAWRGGGVVWCGVV